MPAKPAPSFLILETGQPIPSLARHGGFGQWIARAAGLRRDEVNVVDVQRTDRELTGDRNGPVAGVLVSGSAAMVTDQRDWSERCADRLRAAVAQGVPVFGICYGHQLLAHALGGEVGDNPRGREMGSRPIQCTPAASTDPLFRDLPPSLLVHTTHLQTVLTPPPDAALLARSALDDCQAFRFGEHAWGVQFHPEFSVRTMRGYVAARADALRGEGSDADAIACATAATPLARRILRRFVGFARARPSPLR